LGQSSRKTLNLPRRPQKKFSIEEAAEVFFDPFYQYGDATPTEVHEQRDFILGYSVAQRLLLVVSTERHERTLIISARLATRAERKHYESS
jgi:uncharacterized DUF497 family protein